MDTAKDKLRNRFKKNVYLKPDEYLNGWAKKCGWKATLVYDSLWRHADKDGRSFPSIELMAEEHGVGYNTIRRGLKKLVDYKLVTVSRKRNTSGKFLHNTYVLTDKNMWTDPQPSQGDGLSRALSGKNHSPVRAHKGTHKKGTHIIHQREADVESKETKDKIVDNSSPTTPCEACTPAPGKTVSVKGSLKDPQCAQCGRHLLTKTFSNGGASYEWQDMAVRMWKQLGMTGNPSPSWFKLFKQAYKTGRKGLLTSVFASVADLAPKNPDKYFYKVYFEKHLLNSPRFLIHTQLERDPNYDLGT